jgi:dolichol-phosphate mannosyltransferase
MNKAPAVTWLTSALAIGAATGLLLATARAWGGPSELWDSPFSYQWSFAVLVAMNAGALVAVWEGRAVIVAAATSIGVCWGWQVDTAATVEYPSSLLGALAVGYLLGAVLRQVEKSVSQPPPDPGVATACVGGPDRRQVWIIIPTLNERVNICLLLSELRTLVPSATIVVVDDESPDGTAAAVDELARTDRHIRLLVREERGIDGAWLTGLREALGAGADVVVTMDADRSHAPADVPRLMAALRDAEVVIGSRYIHGGRTEGWPLRRRVLSILANVYARYVLELETRDCSSGFRAYRGEALRGLLENLPEAAGYALLEVLLYQARQDGLRVVEVPITFRERRSGSSKLRLREAWNGARLLWRFRRKAEDRGAR